MSWADLPMRLILVDAVASLGSLTSGFETGAPGALPFIKIDMISFESIRGIVS